MSNVIDRIISREGGYVNNPNDRGGETKYGISKRANPNVDIKNLTADGARKIYQRKYIDPLKLGNMSNAGREVAIDAAVNHGKGFARRMVRQAGDNPAAMIAMRRQKYANIIANNPSQATFKNGWENRMQGLENELGLKGGTVAKYTDPQMMASQERVMDEEYDQNGNPAQQQDPNQDQQDTYQPSFLQSALSGLAQMDTRGMYGAWVGAAGAGLSKGVQNYQEEMSKMRSNMSRKMGKSPIYMNVDGQTKLGVIDNEGNWHESKTPEGAQVLRPLNWMNMGDEWISAPKEGIGGRPVPYRGNAPQPQGQPQGQPQEDYSQDGIPQGPQVDDDGIDWNHPSTRNEQAERERYTIDPSPESDPEYQYEQEKRKSQGKMMADRIAEYPDAVYRLEMSDQKTTMISDWADHAMETARKGGTGWDALTAWMPKSQAGRLKAEIAMIRNAVASGELINIKSQGGTFGALSDAELDLLGMAFGVIEQSQDKEEVIRQIKVVQTLMKKGRASAYKKHNNKYKQIGSENGYVPYGAAAQSAQGGAINDAESNEFSDRLRGER